MNNSSVQRVQHLLRLVDASIPTERRVSPAEVAGDYTRMNEIANQLKIMQDLLQDAGYRSNLDKDFILGMKKAWLESNMGAATFQALKNDELSRSERKKEEKDFQKYLGKLLPKALSTAPEIDPEDGSIINKMPIQSAFAYILLDKYIPDQEEALLAIGQEVNLAGYAQSLFSPLIELIKSFDSASLGYNFGSYLAQTKNTNTYANSYDMISDRLDAEKARLNNDLNVIASANKLLTQIITKVEGNSSLTDEQKTQLKEISEKYKVELEAIKKQLEELSSYLNGIKLEKSSDLDKAFTVSGNTSVVDLQTKEQTVVDGKENLETGLQSGGELTFFNGVVADMQNYGDLSQTTQLLLKLQIAAMQQQWLLVASSLKLMHNTYRTMSNAING